MIENYEDESQWEDLVLLPDFEDQIPLININYGPELSLKLKQFLTVHKNNEISLRSYLLTKNITQTNAGNYTAWSFLKKLITGLGIDLSQELDYIKECIKNDPKNYQVWHHYRWIILQGQWEDNFHKNEFQFNIEMLDIDSKNFHAWSHRKWLVEHFGLPWTEQLNFTEEFIDEDVRNNSIWNFRFLILKKLNQLNPEQVLDEIQFAASKLDTDENNESVWNYIFALSVYIPSLKKHQLSTILERPCDSKKKYNKLIFKAKLYQSIGFINESIEVYKSLLNEDPIRKNYWLWKIELLTKSLE